VNVTVYPQYNNKIKIKAIGSHGAKVEKLEFVPGLISFRKHYFSEIFRAFFFSI
jgi:hypothetical protein